MGSNDLSGPLSVHALWVDTYPQVFGHWDSSGGRPTWESFKSRVHLLVIWSLLFRLSKTCSGFC